MRCRSIPMMKKARTDKTGGADGLAPVKPKYIKTTEQFIEQARDVHGDKYDYSLVDYINRLTKVKVVCPHHGVFEVCPKSHLSGTNCRLCAYEINAHNRRWDTDTFIKKAVEVHGGRYDYSKSQVVNANTKCIIVCRLHGEFKIKPTTHVLGVGCRKCAGEKLAKQFRVGTEEFIRRAREVHGSRYDYSKVSYTKKSEDVEIVCQEHGVFLQTPTSHIRGSNCPKCVTLFYESHYWDVHEETNLYVLQIHFSGHSMIKVGISKDIEMRIAALKSDLKNEERLSIDVIKKVLGPSKEICKFEKELHSSNQIKHIYVGVKFGGHTECYRMQDKDKILGLVSDLEKQLRRTYARRTTETKEPRDG